MKNISLMISLCFLPITFNAQNLYFNSNNILFINNKLFEININNNSYLIKNGRISNNGKFISGYLVSKDKNIKELSYNDNDYGLNDYFKIDTLEMVIYSVESAEIIYSKNQTNLSYFLFSDNENFLLIKNYFDDSILYDLKDRKIKWRFINHEDEFNFNNNNLFFIVNKQCEINIKSMNLQTMQDKIIKKYKKIYCDDFNNCRFYIEDEKNHLVEKTLDDKIVIYYIEENDTTFFLEIVKDSKVFFNCLQNNELYIWGCDLYKNFCGLFNINFIENKITKIFDSKDFSDYFLPKMINNIIDIIPHNDSIIFLTDSILKEERKLFCFNIDKKKFSKLTEIGCIELPWGYFYK